MGLLPWVLLIIAMISGLSFFQTQQLVEKSCITALSLQAGVEECQQLMQNVSEYSQMAYKGILMKKKPQGSGDLSAPAGQKPRAALEDEIVPHFELPTQSHQAIYASAAQRPELKLTRFAHLEALFSHEPDGSQRKNIEKLIFTRLLQKNYRTLLAAASVDTNISNPDLFYERFVDQILQEVSKVSETISVRNITRLANFELPIDAQSYVLYRLFSGGSSGGSSGRANCQFPKLASLISLRKRASILSVYLAPRAILAAITDSPSAVETIIQERTQLHANLIKMGTGRPTADERASIQEEFRAKVSPCISQEIDLQYIDFSISKTAP